MFHVVNGEIILDQKKNRNTENLKYFLSKMTPSTNSSIQSISTNT